MININAVLTVGQVMRYMGYVMQELAEPDQTVRGVIIALEDDQRMRRALAMTPLVDFYRYQISFKLLKGVIGLRLAVPRGEVFPDAYQRNCR